jgi:hypothetical protein
MTMRDFLDAGYAHLVASYESVGMDLVTATENVDRAIGLSEATGENHVASDQPLQVDNDASLRELSKLMGGVGA